MSTADLEQLGFPPITSDVPGSFPWHVWHDRHPALLHQISGAHPFSQMQVDALAALLDETLHGRMQPLPDGAAGKHEWDRWGASLYGSTWLEAPFLWAESYFYRRLLEATGYFQDGLWRGVDPFAFLKSAELTTPNLQSDLETAATLTNLRASERIKALVHASLWGNQADLGFRIGVAATSGSIGPSEHLVADDTDHLLKELEAGPAKITVVADNAGRELISDLLLIDCLVQQAGIERVDLHLKPYPYYVSDATTADLAACLRRLAAAEGEPAAVAARLHAAVRAGQVVIKTHPFYCTPLTFHDLPADLAAELASADLVLLKGDLNYRRLVRDEHWPTATAFATATSYFRAPVAALRTLKSDVLVGVDVAKARTLDASDSGWRTNGRYAVVQTRLDGP